MSSWVTARLEQHVRELDPRKGEGGSEEGAHTNLRAHLQNQVSHPCKSDRKGVLSDCLFFAPYDVT